MTDTWVPRGTETARLLYDAPGWVGFTNLNIFGFTGYESNFRIVLLKFMGCTKLYQADERCSLVELSGIRRLDE